MEKKTIVFCGTPAFAVPSLNALAHDDAFDVRLVITQPDRPVGRAKAVTPPPVKLAAEELHIPVIQPEDINEPSAYAQLPTPFDYLVVIAYGQILSRAILDLPAIAPVNVHASLLPRWRGASPVEHAILAGDTRTGVSIQTMVEELDAGPILSMKETSIGPNETAEELKERLCHLGATLLLKTLKESLHPTPQPSEGITFCRKLTREDGEGDLQALTAEEMNRRVRALVPWPGVTIHVDNQPLKLLEASLVPSPGSIAFPCREGSLLHLVSVQPPGKKPMSAQEWMRGKRA